MMGVRETRSRNRVFVNESESLPLPEVDAAWWIVEFAEVL